MPLSDVRLGDPRIIPKHFVQTLPLDAVLELEGCGKLVKHFIAQVTEVCSHGSASMAKAQSVILTFRIFGVELLGEKDVSNKTALREVGVDNGIGAGTKSDPDGLLCIEQYSSAEDTDSDRRVSAANGMRDSSS